MKCVVLAGGTGERLWPLSRKNCPKQFIEIENNHSIFQDTIARNIPYCDEFIIVTNIKYKFLIQNQLEPFQGLNYRCIYEEEGKKTTAAIVLACLSLEPTEYILVTNTNLLIESPQYQEAILEAKKNAKMGYISILASKENYTDNCYGYVLEHEGDLVTKYVEKPTDKILGDVYKNLGFLVFQNGVLLNEIPSAVLLECKAAYKQRVMNYGSVVYKKDLKITQIPIEKSLLEKAKNVKLVMCDFSFRYIRTLEDLSNYKSSGIIINNSDTTKIINTSQNKAIVVNGIEDLIVVNTEDALYIGKNGIGLKELLQNEEMKGYGEQSNIYNRPWGMYEVLATDFNYQLKRVQVNPGKTIYEHKHSKRIESWTILTGIGKFSINSVESICSKGKTVVAQIGEQHQISNVGDGPLVFMEISMGEILLDDMSGTSTKQTNDMVLGRKIDPMVKLKPALKDYLWGGDWLKKKYGLESDLDIIAEAWVLSAHPDGESTILTGRYKGLSFQKYIEMVGKEVLGWKCSSYQDFPMLVKFIDAKADLSIQVHPDDEYALEYERQYGKSEMWYVIDSKPGAGLYVGFNRDVNPDEIRYRIQNNTITEVLNFYPTKPGDVFFIPAGTIHAICEGNLICEIQQSSNCTYRLYDYYRVDKFGRQRELQIENALDVLNFNKYVATQGPNRCKYFENEIVEVDAEKTFRMNNDRFVSIVCIEGTGEFSINAYKLDVKAGDCVFIPAQIGILVIKGFMKLIIIHI